MAYLFIVVLTEATRARTYFSMGRTVDAAIVASDCVTKVLLFVLEGRKKSLMPQAGSKGSEDLAGPISQALFLWLNRLFLAGYKGAFIGADLERISSPLYTKSIFPRFKRLARGGINGGTEAKATTLMVSDVQQIVSGLVFIHEVWAGVMETALATYLLQRIMGVSSISMLALVVVCGLSSSFVAGKISVQQRKWFNAMEQRLDATKRLLDSLKSVKMRGAEDRVGQVVNELRRLEIRAARPFRALLTASVFLSYSTVTLSPLLVFAAYININGGNDKLDTATMFSSLILIALLSTPLIHLFQAFPALGGAQGCFRRIHAFLEISERSQGSPTEQNSVSSHDKDYEMRPSPRKGGAVALSICDASLGWSPGEPMLRGINLHVRGGSVVAIVGKTGSGKSLLLKSIIGEAGHVIGAVNVSIENVAFCSQTPWLENISAEKTWTQYGSDDTEWLAEVLQACSLDDLTNLPDYRIGKIGSGGVRISGGQRQRLALARAVALRKDVVLLDDVFSALDRTTRHQVSTRLLGPEGLLRKSGATVLFTTHDASIARLADEVYEISVYGTLAPAFAQAKGSIEKATATKSANLNDENALKAHAELAVATVAQKTGYENDDLKKPVSDRQVYLRYARAMGFQNTGIFLFLTIAFADFSHLMFFTVPASASSLHASLLRTILLAPFAYISRLDTGSLMNRLNQDLLFVDALLPLDLFNTCAELFTSLIQLVLVGVVSKQALSVLPVLVAVLYLIQRVYLRSSKQLRLLDLDSKADLHTKFGETASGLSVIRANGWVTPMRQKFMEKLDRSQEPFYLLYMVQRWLQLVLNLVVAGLAITIAGVAIALKGKVAAGSVGVAFLNITTLGETLTNFMTSWTSLETSLGAISRVSSFEKETPTEHEQQSTVGVPKNWPSASQIIFNNVWAAYDDKGDGSNWTLSGVTLTVQPGERVAVCGRTGSGKSSLLLTLLGMLKTSIGSIHVDGIDISGLQMSALRRRIQVVSQDSFFEPTSTFRQELDPDSRLEHGKIEELLRDCRVWEVVEMSGGLVGKRADAKLSAGEAQLLAIARLLLQNPAGAGGLILLDEATSR
ncbi:hypothetical protein N0V82_005998 [Gnomoniopsis sp. IMI 355080]|nr:hypothetical protein N0V82_005998 [Gnomoniopsis sp. IMI 355080]